MKNARPRFDSLALSIHTGLAAAARTAAHKASEKLRWKEYAAQARALTEQQPLHQLPGYHLRGAGGYVVDHVVSIWAAFREGWPVERAATLDNLQVVPSLENFTKGTRSYCSLEAHYLPIAA